MAEPFSIEDYKYCSKCGEMKPLEDFYRDRTKPDGRKPHCKECASAAHRAWQIENRDRHAANLRSWRAANPDRAAQIDLDSRQRYPEKDWARRLVVQAVASGKIEKPAECENCGAEVEKAKLQGHHEDYSKPFDVCWLCPLCHGARHPRKDRSS